MMGCIERIGQNEGGIEDLRGQNDAMRKQIELLLNDMAKMHLRYVELLSRVDGELPGYRHDLRELGNKLGKTNEQIEQLQHAVTNLVKDRYNGDQKLARQANKLFDRVFALESRPEPSDERIERVERVLAEVGDRVARLIADCFHDRCRLEEQTEKMEKRVKALEGSVFPVGYSESGPVYVRGPGEEPTYAVVKTVFLRHANDKAFLATAVAATADELSVGEGFVLNALKNMLGVA